MDTVSFCGPCLKWKFLLASKAQMGFNGFVAPWRTKWLHAHAQQTVATYNGAGVLIATSSASADFQVDRFTGDIAVTGPENLQPSILLQQADKSGPDWVVRDDYLSHRTGAPGPFAQVATYEVQLSDEYTLARLEADLDAYIAAFNPDTVPWFTLNDNISPDLDYAPNYPVRMLAPRLPGSILYPFTPGSPLNVPELRAAAFYVYEPSNLDGANALVSPTFGGGFWGYLMKLVGHIAMAGKYCEKTSYVDPQQLPAGTSGCTSGQGGCGKSFVVNPPQIIPGWNGFKLVVPNCECG